MPRNDKAFADSDHDHRSCVATALQTATEVCRRDGARLTDLRRRVLELVWSSHRPLGAYNILQALQADGRSAAPPTVYRALEFLAGHGLVHRIASLNAFVGCSDPRARHPGQFLICRQCDSALEMNDPAISDVICNSAARLDFQVDEQTIEVIGVCPNCSSAGGGG